MSTLFVGEIFERDGGQHVEISRDGACCGTIGSISRTQERAKSACEIISPLI
jgi:hypothetical protein